MNNTPFSEIQPIKFWCQKILPLVYDNSLSYYEVLCKFSSKLNEIISTLNNFESDVYNYIDQKINAITTDWTNIVYSILSEYANRFDEKLNKEHEWNVKQHAEIIAQISGQIQIINDAVINGDNANRDYINAQIAKLKTEIPVITSVMVYDPTSGQLVDIQIALNNIYDKLRCGALTAAEYDALQISAEHYDSLLLTAFDYDCCGWRYLWPNNAIGFMFSPFTGEWTEIKNVVSALADFHRAISPTAQEYDNAEYTADEFNNLLLTAYAYSWNFTARS